MRIKKFEDLVCWKEARILVQDVYKATRDGDFWKDYRLAGQIQGAATSVMANIVGFVRHSDKEFIQILFIAMSSAAEAQSHLYVALDQGYLTQQVFESLYSQADKTDDLVKSRQRDGCVKSSRCKERKT